jgi:predicted  nucleic acid-binding Zn-ribbon protein
MSSKSPVRSCEDVDETALSYAEIKALCAGNPLIAEKMNLDNEVAKLRMLKSEHQSQHFRLEDDILKRFPEQIISVKERIAGIEKDIETYAAEKAKCVDIQTGADAVSVSPKFPGMTIYGATYDEKETAAKALLESCKGVKGVHSDVPIGEYMGFKMSLHYESFAQQINLLMRGVMTYKIDLGTDSFGNITRINNALEKLPERLDGAKSQLENIEKQVEAAKLEVKKPFEQEDELQEKEARLALLNADLNIDGDGNFDVINDFESRDEPEDEAEDKADDEAYADDELDDEFDDEPSEEARPNYSYTGTQTTQPASAKSKPSILDGIRNFDSSKHNGGQGKDKPTGHII